MGETQKYLVALYTITTDLNSTKGEWGDLKIWRNAIEHRILVIIEENTYSSDPLQVIDEQTRGDIKVSKEEFFSRTLHFLQITRSAIFSFAFCVRTEGLKASPEGGIPFTLTEK